MLVVDSPTNLVHLLKLNNDGAGNLTGADYWAKGEFLASTDERFRPVSLTPSWDGSVLIVDMYRGVSQDEPIQTDYLKNYIMQHRLWDGIHKGRIYRIIHTGMKPARAKPQMIEKHIAGFVAQDFMQRRPRRRGFDRVVEELLDPRGIEVLGFAIPRASDRPNALGCWARRSSGCLRN